MTQRRHPRGRRSGVVAAGLVALAVGAGTAGVTTVLTAPEVRDATAAMSADRTSLDQGVVLVDGTTTDRPASGSQVPTTTTSVTGTSPTTTTTTSSAPPVTTTTTATTTTTKPTTTTSKAPTDTSMPGQVLALTNTERAKAGCSALVLDSRLNQAAQAHSADMSAQHYFSHTSLDGRTFVDRAKAAGYPNPGAENIAMGQRSAAEVMNSWMNSAGHRANILNCGLKTMGLGFVQSGYYWTQMFGW